ERDMALLQNAIVAARTIRSEHEVHPAAKVLLRIRSQKTEHRALFEREARFIVSLVKTEGNPVVEGPGERPPGHVLSVADDVDVLVDLRGLVEWNKEEERIDRTLKKIDKDLASLERRLNDPKFTSNAPPDVVAQTRDQKGQLERQRARLIEERSIVEELKKK